MPVFILGDTPSFPPPELADSDGIIAIGGDLSPQRLLNAYSHGIFPWYSKGDPILWWSPDPRLVLFPGELHISKSMARLLRKNTFRLTVDGAFKEVIGNCSLPRRIQKETWLTPEMKAAYVQLHRLGYAHSVEVWQGKTLVGGFYGISLGKCFFGESMFFKVANASKFAFVRFAQRIFELDYRMIDCQVPTTHLKSLGAREIPRKKYLALLRRSLEHEGRIGKWTDLFEK